MSIQDALDKVREDMETVVKIQGETINLICRRYEISIVVVSGHYLKKKHYGKIGRSHRQRIQHED